MTYINFDSSNEGNIELVKKKFNVWKLNCGTVSPEGPASRLFDEIEKFARISPRGVFIDVTGLDPVIMAYINPVCAALKLLDYVPFVVSNSMGKLVNLTYYYDFNEFDNITDTNQYIELLKKVESLSNL